MDHARLKDIIFKEWDESLQPALEAFIEIPNQSPAFDPEWATNGLQEKALDQYVAWVKAQGVKGLELEVLRPEGRTPLIFAEVEGSGRNTVFLYGHLDKQPPFEGWDENKGPWKPVVEDGKLYGRGAVDDGYAPYSAVTLIKALQEMGKEHPRCVLFIEFGEESGSPDIDYYFERLQERIGDVSMIVVPDSGCGDYERLWFTSSLRGMVAGSLEVSTVRDGVHSGSASGIVVSSFRVARELLDRIEDAKTGDILLPELNVEIPEDVVAKARATAEILGPAVRTKFPVHEGVRLWSDDDAQLLLNVSYRPTLSVVGAEGFPTLQNAGNVLRPRTALKLSLRLPPGVDPDQAASAVKRALESDPPFNARVSFDPDHGAPGWAAPAFPKWLSSTAQEASQAFYGNEALYYGEGGSIPLLAKLGEVFPEADSVVVGLAGPNANPHGPNEFLHLDAAKKLVCCLAAIVAKRAQV